MRRISLVLFLTISGALKQIMTLAILITGAWMVMNPARGGVAGVGTTGVRAYVKAEDAVFSTSMPP